ncbi:hypothetical protein ACFWNL_29480 [Kitasatospora sp. NPDC058397]|uniref:hypothetical protein n=1 Tax=unclassified Kitasatospora TaxID=2633591 RepID=UPI00366444D8
MVEVPGAEAFQGGAALGGTGLGGAAFGGVEAKEVVEPVAVVVLVGEQVGGGQVIEDGPDGGGGGVGQGGCRAGADADGRGQGEQPEQGPGLGGERAVGEVEGGADRRGGVAVDDETPRTRSS